MPANARPQRARQRRGAVVPLQMSPGASGGWMEPLPGGGGLLQLRGPRHVMPFGLDVRPVGEAAPGRRPRARVARAPRFCVGGVRVGVCVCARAAPSRAVRPLACEVHPSRTLLHALALQPLPRAVPKGFGWPPASIRRSLDTGLPLFRWLHNPFSTTAWPASRKRACASTHESFWGFFRAPVHGQEYGRHPSRPIWYCDGPEPGPRRGSNHQTSFAAAKSWRPCCCERLPPLDCGDAPVFPTAAVVRDGVFESPRRYNPPVSVTC